MTRKRYIDERQMGLDFDRQVEDAIEVMSQLAKGQIEINPDSPVEDETIDCDSLYVLIAEACKDAIREFGASREQIVDALNAMFTFSESEGTTNPITIHLLNNYLSKPTLNRLPIWAVMGICAITGNHGPMDVITKKLGLTVITGMERLHLHLGRADELARQSAATKRSILKEIGTLRGRIR